MCLIAGSDALENRRTPNITDEVVEIGLLLPANRVKALLDLSRQRHQSVGQILRGLIENALTSPVE